MSPVARALKIHSGEGRLAVSMIALSFLVLAGQAIGQSGVTGLFFAQVGTDALPVVYLLQGGAALALTIVLAAMLGRVDQRRAFLGMSAALLAVVVAERVALAAGPTWIYWALWLTVALAVLVQTVVLWGIAGIVTDTRQAKRLFPLFAAGGILGSVLGGVLTAPIVRLVGTADLLVVWAATLTGALGLTWVVLERRPTERATHHRVRVLRDLAAAWRYVSGSALLRWMTLAAVLFSVLFFSLFLPFAAAASARYPSADDLAAFFGLFAALTTAAAFLISTLGTNRMFARFGIAAAVMIFPLLYVGSFGVLLVTATFASLVTVRAVTAIWLQGVASPAWETLTNVVPDHRRDQVRAFLNGGPSQAGTAIAGVIALVGTDLLSPRQLTIVGLVTAAVTLFVTWRIKRSYAAALVDALRAGRPVFADDPTLVVPFALDHDAQALGSVLAAADDPDPSARQLAAQLLADVDDDRATAALQQLLHDPQPGVAATAAAALAARSDDPDVEARLGALVADPDPAIRTAALVALRRSPGRLAAGLAREAVQDEDPSVRAPALITLAIADADGGAATALMHLDDSSPRVRRAAGRAAALIGDPAVPSLLDALDRPAAREAALDALTRIELPEDRPEERDAVRGFAADGATEAIADRALADAIADDGGAADLLRAGLVARGRHEGAFALRASSLTRPDGVSMRAAIADLDTHEAAQLATALETIESTGDPVLVRSLVPLWDADHHVARSDADAVQRAARDPDPFIAMCAERVLADRRGGDQMPATTTAMPIMDRVLFLRRVSLFEALEPQDLMPIAEVADEQTFADGDVVATQGEMGDGLHVIVLGEVRVQAGDDDIAKRGPGDVVGEMSLITRRPRMASLIADGDVRTIWISRRAFEGMLHDRPDIAIGVMRVLARRLEER